MTTCSVLRCPKTSVDVFKLMSGSNLGVPVCGEHKAVLESGARWMVNGGIGLKNKPMESAGISILIGTDLPEHNRLSGFGVSRTIGDELGFSVELDIESPEGPRRISFWTTEDIGNRLGSYLSKPPAT